MCFPYLFYLFLIFFNFLNIFFYLFFTMGHVSSCNLGHATKNCAGQLVSPVRNLHFGSYFVDSTGCRSLGLPPSAYVRSEPMSDALHCTLWNPYYCVTTPVPGFGLMHYDAFIIIYYYLLSFIFYIIYYIFIYFYIFKYIFYILLYILLYILYVGYFLRFSKAMIL